MTEEELQKLREIAKLDLKEDPYKKLSPVKRFMVSAGIEIGTYLVEAILIYDRYLVWCEAYKVVPISLSKFYQEFALYIPKTQKAAGTYYSLNPKGFDLSPQHLELVKQRLLGDKFKKKKTKKERKSKES